MDGKGCAVITRELCPEPGIGGVAEAGRDVEALMERTVWKTRFWEILQGEKVKGQQQGPQTTKHEVSVSESYRDTLDLYEGV